MFYWLKSHHFQQSLWLRCKIGGGGMAIGLVIDIRSMAHYELCMQERHHWLEKRWLKCWPWEPTAISLFSHQVFPGFSQWAQVSLSVPLPPPGISGVSHASPSQCHIYAVFSSAGKASHFWVYTTEVTDDSWLVVFQCQCWAVYNSCDASITSENGNQGLEKIFSRYHAIIRIQSPSVHAMSFGGF